MNFYNLSVFCRVVELESISETAKEMLTSPAAVSGHIREIERHFGVKLTERSGRNIKLTASGLEVYKYALEIEHLNQSLEERLTRLKQTAQSVSIGVTHVIYSLLNQSLKKTQSFTSLDINFTPSPSFDTCTQVEKESLQFGLVSTRMITQVYQTKQLDHDIIFSIPLVIICSPGHPFAGNKRVVKKDLEPHTFLMAPHAKKRAKLAQGGLSFLKNIIEISDIETIKSAVMSGKGLFAVLSYPDVKKEIESGQLSIVHIKDFQFDTRFSIIYRRENQKNSKLIKQHLQKILQHEVIQAPLIASR
ncbi:LysR family transcriptional regulator [Bacillus tuaregi]|uniref:LysR family transcriptional regulator n=1 Tax=Bacillus tuaregi TaxID=1816695 RepID=UPI0008F8DA0A|nr:LysR family transcriptional regulator [Bacillus tuaregi]